MRLEEQLRKSYLEKMLDRALDLSDEFEEEICTKQGFIDHLELQNRLESQRRKAEAAAKHTEASCPSGHDIRIKVPAGVTLVIDQGQGRTVTVKGL